MLGLQELSLQHISNILWAYVSFLQMREPMTSAFLEELQLRLRKAAFNAQQLSNLLWSLCIAEVAPPPVSPQAWLALTKQPTITDLMLDAPALGPLVLFSPERV